MIAALWNPVKELKVRARTNGRRRLGPVESGEGIESTPRRGRARGAYHNVESGEGIERLPSRNRRLLEPLLCGIR